MKKLMSLFLVLCMLLSVSAAVAETWVCPACGTQNEHNFCGECGAKKSTDWVCSGCGSRNTTKFCPECGMSRDNNKPAPVEKEDEKAPAAALQYIPRVEFYRGESKAKIYVCSDTVFYADDYADDVHYHMGLRIENDGDQAQPLTVKARINGQSYSFNDVNLAGKDYHNFYISSVTLEPGSYVAVWTVNDQQVASVSVTVKSGHSDLYNWVQQNLKCSADLCIWDKVEKTRVEDGVTIAQVSSLAANQMYAPHLRLESNAAVDSAPLYVAFMLDGDTWWWEDQVVTPDGVKNYVHSSYEYKTGASELVMYINGMEVATGLFAILGN